MTEKTKGIISKIVLRADKYKEKGGILSKVINDVSQEKNIQVINDNNNNPKGHLNRSKLHFNKYGESVNKCD